MSQINRRQFIGSASLLGAGLILLKGCDAPFFKSPSNTIPGVTIGQARAGEDIFSFILRVKGKMDRTFYRQIIGSANEFKEGDLALGVAADSESSRFHARTLLSNTRIRDLEKNPLFEDDLYTLIKASTPQNEKILNQTMGELKQFMFLHSEEEIKSMMPFLTSDVIACLVKLMSNEELISLGQKVFNPLPGSKIGSKGYLGARIQPNSPTDHIEDITWQVFDAWSYAVGDLILGTNPVSGNPKELAKIEAALQDILQTFKLDDVMPHSVLTHIDIQSEIEEMHPGTTGMWFQSLAGTADANLTFDVTIEKMFRQTAKRKGRWGLYAETGQGADMTNGHGEGFDMVVHEARKYGFLRALKQKMHASSPPDQASWVFFNDVAGFIGPEVFRTREQLVRCCLEDTVMGKLHGLTNGLDICSTLHMDVSLDDLDWCIEQIMPVNPAYLMALPTKNDPMLSYLTTSFSDHLKIRKKFGYKVDDTIWNFFKKLEIIDKNGEPTAHFGDPLWVYYQYCRAKNDDRNQTEIYKEGGKCINRILRRGVPIAEGYGRKYHDLPPELEKEVRRLYNDSKACVWAEMKPSFVAGIPASLPVFTCSESRKDYLYHPASGETISEPSKKALEQLRQKWENRVPEVQIIVSDGLNALSLSDEGHLIPFLSELKNVFGKNNYRISSDIIVITNGRVRAGYECGKTLFGIPEDLSSKKGIIHIIGERPGNGHHCFSAYITVAPVRFWNKKALIDHNITKVVSGISDTSLLPEEAARETYTIFRMLFEQ